jgi:hypothetical protein
MVAVVDKWFGGSASGTFYSETVWWAVWWNITASGMTPFSRRPHISAYLGIHSDIWYIETTFEIADRTKPQPVILTVI